jgi:hypothetical protein
MTLKKITVQVSGGGTQDLLVDQIDPTGITAATALGVPVQKLAPLTPTVLAGNQTLTISTSVVTLTVPSGATHALATVEGGDVRFWEDGTNPTASAGLLLISGNAVEFSNLANVKLIKATGQSDATLNISYRKYGG